MSPAKTLFNYRVFNYEHGIIQKLERPCNALLSLFSNVMHVKKGRGIHVCRGRKAVWIIGKKLASEYSSSLTADGTVETLR